MNEEDEKEEKDEEEEEEAEGGGGWGCVTSPLFPSTLGSTAPTRML